MVKYRISVSIDEKNFFWIVIDNGKFIRNPENIKGTKLISYNKTNICPICRKDNNITDKSILYPKNTRQIYGVWYCEMHSSKLRFGSINIDPDCYITKRPLEEKVGKCDNKIELKGCNNKISKYNPMSKEFQEDTKRLGLTGNQLIYKYINEEKLPNPAKIDRKHLDNLARKKGFKDLSEQKRNEDWYITKHIPISENEDCPHYLGTHIAARKYGRKILPSFGKIKQEMHPTYPKFDFIMEGDIKIDVKSSRKICNYYTFKIRYNDVADYFLLIAFNNRQDENTIEPVYAWLIKGNEMIIKKSGGEYIFEEFYMRDSISIPDTKEDILSFQKYEVKKELYLKL